MCRRYLEMCLYWLHWRNVAIGLRMSALGSVVEVHATRRSWLLVMARHGERRELMVQSGEVRGLLS